MDTDIVPYGGFFDTVTHHDARLIVLTQCLTSLALTRSTVTSDPFNCSCCTNEMWEGAWVPLNVAKERKVIPYKSKIAYESI